MTTYSDYVDKIKQQDPSVFLGEILWFSVSETRVQYDTLRAMLVAAGLDAFVPRRPRDEDVFRRAAPNGQRKRVPTADEDVHVNYLIRQVKRGGGSCTKHVVAETVDTDGVSLAYEEVHELNFDGETNSLTTRPLSSPSDPIAQSIANEVLTYFNANRDYIDAQGLRVVIRAVLDHCKATVIRPTGGVYFVMNEHFPSIKALAVVASQIEGAHLDWHPLVDDDRQREMVRRAYEAETVDAVDHALGEIAELLGKSGKVTVTQYARLSDQFSGLLSKSDEYTNLLGSALAEADAKLKIYRQQMTQLLKRVGK